MILPHDFTGSTAKSSPLNAWTTLRVGGPAEVLCFPDTAEDVQRVIRRCADEDVPWRLLGRGSNLVVSDAGVRGVVIHTRRLRTLRIADDGRVTAGAGLATSVLLRAAMRRGLGGLEAVVGYPSSVGGAARMNAGGKWGETGARVESVTAIDAAGEARTFSADACGFAYRTSSLGRFAVVEVTFRLPEVDMPAYRRRISAIQEEKAAVQPLSEPSAGCVFRNPPEHHAGRLVDACKLKGETVGGAAVSQRHANFIVNRGGATADDVLRLADRVRAEVQRRAGVPLELEVEVWGPERVPPGV